MPDSQPLKLFIVYAREDQPALLELKAHLRPLEKRGDLTVWYDGEILPGQDWDKTLKEQLAAADIVLLFISKHFFNSEYIEREELKKALERHNKGEATVVSVIVKPCHWEAYPDINILQVLPKDGKVVSSWNNVDEAWLNVTKEIERLIRELSKKIAEEQLGEEGKIEIKNAMIAYETEDYELAKSIFQRYILSGKRLPHEAANYLGVMYEKGHGFKQDYHKAEKWYFESATQGNEIAQNNLAIIYEKGYLGEPDYTQAVRWYQKSANKGYHWAQNNLAYLYLQGKGVYRNEVEAFQLFKRAADKGNTLAMTNLGVLFLRTDDIPQDFVEARKYFMAAANHGQAIAEYNLGVIFENGFGVEKDLDQALKWYSKSAAQGEELAKGALKRLSTSLINT